MTIMCSALIVHISKEGDMELTDGQKQAVIAWAKEGLGLSEIQKNLLSEFGLKLTYMDVRFLILEMGCDIRDKKTTSAPKAEEKGEAPGASGDPSASADMGAQPVGGSGVTVDLDRVVKAGSVISGTVVFSDGVKAVWAVDNMGRMVLDPGDRPDYRPTEDDVAAFQVELKRLITKRGY